MHARKWSILVMIGIMVLLFVSCKEAQTSPRIRDLVVVNGTTDTQISGIAISATQPFGQRAAYDPDGTFQFNEEDYLRLDEKFEIVLSPYVYRIAISVYFIEDGSDCSDGTSPIVIDLPAVSTQPTYITLVSNEDSNGYGLEVSGEYVDFSQLPDYK
jgi:hypothetical protein